MTNSTLVVLKFPTDEGAENLLGRLESLQKQQLITVVDGAIVTWPDGASKPKIEQLRDMTGVGALGGAFWGMLFGLLFFVPFFGLAVGAAMGALAGHFAHYGIDDDFINSVRSQITPGTSSLFLLTSGAVLDKVAEGVKDIQFEIIQTNLSKEQEALIKEAFGEESADRSEYESGLGKPTDLPLPPISEPPPLPPEGLSSPPLEPEEPAARYVNSWFEGHPGPHRPLRFGQEYKLSIQVSPEQREGNFTSDRPEFSEPDFGTQEMLDVVVAIVTDDFKVLDRSCQRMQLPRVITKTSSAVTFKVKPIKNNQDVHISVLFYHENNLFHEALIRAQVQVIKTQKSVTEYMPTVNKFYGPIYGQRDINLQVSEWEKGYRFILFHDFGGNQFDVIWCKIPISREKLARLLKEQRDELIKFIHTKIDLDSGKQKEIFFEGEPIAIPFSEGRLPQLPAIDDIVYTESLTSLAKSGFDLYMSLFNPNKGSLSDRSQVQQVRKTLRHLSAGRALRVQVLSEEFFIPWNLLYDGDYPSDEIIVNPGEFWGFKHVIEELPYHILEREAVGLIKVEESPLKIGMNINRANIPEGLTRPQLALAQKYEVSVIPRYTEKEVRQALLTSERSEECEVEYFYCHAGTGGTPEGSFDRSYLGLTSAKTGLTLKEIRRLTIDRGNDGHFQRNSLFILNACESVRMDGRFYDGFVPHFLGMGACAVIGTDSELPSLFGAHFGSAFLDLLCRGVSIGEALRQLRKQFLEEQHNPLGLIYRVFGNADVRLSRPIIRSSTMRENR